MSGPIFHREFEQQSSEWEYRRSMIPTASEMHRIVTPKELKPSKQAYPYMMRLLASWWRGRPVKDSEFQSDYMELGHENEAAAVSAFEFQMDMRSEKIGFVTRADEMLGCSPDRIIPGIGTLEVKSPSPQVQLAYLLDNDALYDEYRLQVQTQLLVLEWDKGFIASHEAEFGPVILERGRDEKVIAAIEAAANTFIAKMLEYRERVVAILGPPLLRQTQSAEGHQDGIPDYMNVSMDDLRDIGILPG